MTAQHHKEDQKSQIGNRFNSNAAGDRQISLTFTLLFNAIKFPYKFGGAGLAKARMPNLRNLNLAAEYGSPRHPATC
jgi:hypothetical protein